MIRWSVLLITAMGAVLPAPGAATAAEDPTPVVIIVHPAAAPEPALKYRLLPDRDALQPGNAAIFYHRAIEMMLQARRSSARADRHPTAGPSDEDIWTDWLDGPIATIPLDRARGWLDRNRRALHESELGARRLACDWGLDARPEGFNLMIDEIQQMREMIRLVALRTRVAIADGRTDEAVHWLQTGYAMSRHVGQAPFVIPMLIGLASCVHLNRAMTDLIQAPGTPSLYWALIDRPRPFIDRSGPLAGERFFLEREIPELRELDGLPWSVAKARAFAGELQTKLYKLSDWSAPARMGWGDQETGDWMNRLGIAALVARSYPEAKRSLIARGRPAAQVEAMPTLQVAFLDAYLSYQVYRDDVFKWVGLPYHHAYAGMDRAQQRCGTVQGRPLLRFFCSLFGPVRSALLAAVRGDRQLDALACVEAIRIHAAAHDRFPARLDDLGDAPAPLDPMTGRPFQYRIEEDRAFLTAPDPPGGPANVGYAIRYELRLAR